VNPNYVQRIREDLDTLLDTQFIFSIETTQWLSPLVIVPKKNGKLHICADYQKLNSQTKKDPFPLPPLDSILDTVAGHEMYSFMDGYNGYNQVKMAEKIKTKCHLFLNGEHMPITLCHLDYVMF
jgi:hypothetical protein